MRLEAEKPREGQFLVTNKWEERVKGQGMTIWVWERDTKSPSFLVAWQLPK